MAVDQVVGAEPEVVFRPSRLQRLGFDVVAVVGLLVIAIGVRQDSFVWLLFLVPCVAVIVEQVRTRVVIDRVAGVVRTTRILRTRCVAIDDVVAVRVPPWGPVLLTLRDAASWNGVNWPGQISTGIQVPHRGADTVAHRLADALGVPVESVWPGVRSRAAIPDAKPSWFVVTAVVILMATLAVFTILLVLDPNT